MSSTIHIDPEVLARRKRITLEGYIKVQRLHLAIAERRGDAVNVESHARNISMATADLAAL